ncbi:hypothetical protein V2S66_28345 [Streptomyces sp. V4-01]|uniref:Ricin B lectin domain-containing protein n=1 Tax=Actinacidiphila polyblastidii TaxID=3110430 RepID=A0ABU7PJ59_9ACTN|nr:hypothetical protein [Streptomyces sp. V4-01]
MHGLGIVKSGGTWYAFGEDKTGENSPDTSFRSIPCCSSTDLHTWTYRSSALSRQASGDLGPKRVVATIVQWPATGGANQTWSLRRAYGNVYSLVMVLDVPKKSTTAGTALDQWTSNGGSNQVWRVS